MELTQEQLNNLEQLAKNLLTQEECAIALEVDLTNFLNEVKLPGTRAYKAYHKGRLEAKIQHTQSVRELSMRGSSPAQQMMKRIIDETDIKNI